MSSLAHSLVTWAEFLELPERPENGQHYELHDGEVVIVPPPRPLHLKIQKRLEVLLMERIGARGVVYLEFPYRPALNLQFWYADIACIPSAEWDAMPNNTYDVYAPVLIIEVLSPSNRPAKINRQRMVALSAGTQVFWVVDADERTVHVTNLTSTQTYGLGEAISSPLFPGSIPIDQIFTV
jgi:Uma2 family endonuclease